MERRERKPSNEPSQMAEEGWSFVSEQRRTIMAVTQMLDSGTLDEKSSRLLGQLASCIRCLPVEAALGSGPDPGVTRQSAPLEDAPAKTEPSEEPGAEPGPSGPPKEPADKRVVVGSLRTTPEDKWTCKVPSCTGSFHRLKDCRFFLSMEPEDRVELVEHHDLCLGCLTPGHGRTACSCPYTEERADACQRSSCKGRHHRLLHVDKRKAKRSPGKGSLTQPPSVPGDPTLTKDPGCEVQLVAQWVSTKGGAPSLVFRDMGSQVTLVTHKVAQAMGLPAIPGSPLRLEGIGDGHRPRATTSFKVPLVDTGGRVITVTAYGVDNIMSPLGGGDITLMRKAFPEVPAGGLVPASGEVGLLMGQDNLSLFPTERWRVGNAALYMSRFGTGWIASGKPPRAKGGGSSRHVRVCVVSAASRKIAARPKPHQEDTAICALSTVSQQWVAPPLHIEGGIFQPYDFLTSESLGTDLPRRCTSCRRCKECKFRTDSLTFKEDQEYQIILDGLEFNKERGRWRATYPFHIPPSTLKDNYEQVFRYTLAQERRLAKQGRTEESTKSSTRLWSPGCLRRSPGRRWLPGTTLSTTSPWWSRVVT
jgi:hypothetical protein